MPVDPEITEEMLTVVGMISALEEEDFETCFTLAQEVGYEKAIVSLVALMTGLIKGMAQHNQEHHQDFTDPRQILTNMALSIARGDWYEESDDCEED